MTKKSTILTVFGLAALAFVVFLLRGCPGPAAWLTSGIDSTDTQQPTPPPPSDSIPNAPGPDNTITNAPPPVTPERPAGPSSPSKPNNPPGATPN